jgi:hypothetical protein
MPFGLTNAPSIFMRRINEGFSDMLDMSVVIYLDDILIFSETKDDHDTQVKKVLQRLRELGLYAKLEKCEFDLEEVEFCGFIVGRNGTRMSQVKVEAILHWPTPKSLKEVQSFLGLTNFYRRFISNYSKIAKPLTDMTKKDHVFLWSSSAQEAFDHLKRLVAVEPVLQHPDLDKPFIVETDASHYALGAVLS